jgi:arylsulfatase A-like enzyme
MADTRSEGRGAGREGRGRPPNVLYLHSHDTGRAIQPYGWPVPTPHLQHLAEEGVLFRRAFSAAPTCSPSRAALLTGQYPHANGMLGLAHNGFRLHERRHHLAHHLRGLGYQTALCGVQHEDRDARALGYERVLETGGSRRADVLASAAAAFLRAAPPAPFFLSVGFVETHRDFDAPGPAEDPRYCLPPPTLPDAPETRADMAAYTASARSLDRGIGAVLAALADAGLADETLVIATTDHGPALPGMKCSLTDHGTGVLLLIRGPGGFGGGRVVDAMVSQLDVCPTLCELLGTEIPPRLQGRSLLPLIRGEVAALHERLFAEVSYHAAYEPQRAVRTERWKYIRRFDGRDRPVLANCDDGLSKDYWLAHGWRDRPRHQEELYDLIFDPQEAANVAGDPALAAVREELRGHLERWMRETDDPLLTGSVPVPPDAVVRWTPDDRSPRQGARPVGPA